MPSKPLCALFLGTRRWMDVSIMHAFTLPGLLAPSARCLRTAGGVPVAHTFRIANTGKTATARERLTATCHCTSAGVVVVRQGQDVPAYSLKTTAAVQAAPRNAAP